MLRRKAIQLLYWDGAFAMVYDTWMGPTYLSGLAGELGASVFCVSLLASAVWIGAVGQVLGAWAYERADSYKTYTLKLALASRVLWLLPLVLAGFWTFRKISHGEAFPVDTWCKATAVVACLVALFGASSAAGWNSWVRGLVPVELRGRFFGNRQRYVMGALVGANVLALLLVGFRPQGYYVGYAILGVAAVIAAALSLGLLGRVPDIERIEKPAPEVLREPFIKRWLSPLQDRKFRGLVFFGAAFNGSIQLASSYFPYYFTKELHIPMSQVAFWFVLTNLGCLGAASAWGKYIDRSDDPRKVLKVTAILVALSPMLYVFPSADWVKAIAPFEYFSNGIVWIGYQLALTTALFRSVRVDRPAACFSLYSAAAGLAGALCSLLGGRLAVWLAPYGGFRALWVIATACRLLVIWGVFRFLNDAPASPAAPPSETSEDGELLAEYA